DQTPLHGTERQDNGVVLIPDTRLPLGRQYANYLTRRFADTQFGTDWIFIAKQLPAHGLPNHTHRIGSFQFGLSKHTPTGQTPAIHLKILRRGADYWGHTGLL